MFTKTTGSGGCTQDLGRLNEIETVTVGPGLVAIERGLHDSLED